MATDLITLAEYKAYAGINSDNQDTLINTLIPKVSALVKKYCRRSFIDYVDEAKTEYYNGGIYFLLDEYPVRSVSSVEISTDYGATTTELVEFTDYALDKANDRIVPLNSDKYFTEYPNGYIVKYTGGYETLPDELKLAVFDLVTYYIKNDSSVHSPKAPGTNSVQIEYITTTSLPAHIKRVLDLYTANYL